MPVDRGTLGLGVYDLSEAARYTRLKERTVRTWFHGRPDRKGHGPVFHGDYERVHGDFAISFLDLIDLLVAGQLCAAGVKLRVVRSAYIVLQGELRTPHPFCHERIYTDGKSVLVVAAREIGDDRLLDVVSRQQLFLTIRKHLKRIDYVSELASLWNISDGVTIDPRRSFGKPVVGSTSVTTFVLANQYRANANDEVLVAELYGVDPQDVRSAVAFEEHFGHAA